MSFLFRAVLGQRVVHPPPPKSNSESNVVANGVLDTKSPAKHAAKSGSASSVSNGVHDKASTSKLNGDAAASLSARTGPSVTASASLAGTQSTSVSSFQSSPPPRPSTPTRTLLLRIQGCIVAQDIRDAQRDLLRCPDLPYALDVPSLKSLLDLLVSYAEDESITEPTLHLLANATNLDSYPDQLESNRRVIEVDVAAKRQARDVLLQQLFEAVPVLLDSMKATAPFWSRYYVVVLLQRLEELDSYKLNQSLLGARGVGVLLDALNEVEHDCQLRNQALALLTSLTLADAELQTLLAFHNAFDSLFEVIQSEGGIRHGKSIVQECLTVVHNMLRSNKATQKFFREMGCAARLAALFDSIPSELAACMVLDGGGHGGHSRSPRSMYPKPKVLTERLEALLDITKTSESMLNVLMSVSILACVLRGVEEDDEERRSTQDALLRCNLLTPLARLAFSGLLIDDATRIEAVRVLALLLRDSHRAVEEWLNLPPVTTLVRVTQPYEVQIWPVPRALLSYICETTDTTLVSAGVQLFTAALSVSACQERAVGMFLSGLMSPTLEHGGGRGGQKAVQPWATTTSPRSNAEAGKGSAVDADAQCGAALARVLLSSRTSAIEKFYAAQVLRALVAVPGAAPVLQDLVYTRVPPPLQTSTLDGLVNAQPGWTLSSRLPPSFFNYLVTFVLFCLSGGAAAQQVNTAALGAYAGALLAWMGSCPVAAAAFVEEMSWGDTLLLQARRDSAAHLRLWSAALLASACVVSGAVPSADAAPPTSAASAAAELARRFMHMVGGAAALDTILLDLKASTPVWQHPVASALRTQHPTPCDEAIVALVDRLVADFKRLLDSVARPVPQMASAAVPLSSSMHVAEQESNHAQTRHRALSPLQPCPSTTTAASLERVENINRQSGDFQTETSLGEPLAASLHVAAAPLLPEAPTRDMVSALQAELEAARAEKENLMNALREWRERAEQTAAKCGALEKEQQKRAIAGAEEERIRMEDAATSAAEVAHSHAASAELVEGLQENIRLLEEALSSKEEEHQQLVESLNMMEEQLRQVSNATAAAASQQQGVGQQRHHQQDHVPSPDMIAAMTAEHNAVAQKLALSQEETARLQRILQGVSNDYNELLLLVAELNEECVSVKAGSSVTHTPARPWPEDAGLSMKSVIQKPQGLTIFDGAMSDKAVPTSAAMLPDEAVVAQRVQWEGTMDSAAAGMVDVKGQEPMPTAHPLAAVTAAGRQTSADANCPPSSSMHAYETAADIRMCPSDGLSHAQGSAALLPAGLPIPLSEATVHAFPVSIPAVSQTESISHSLVPPPRPDEQQPQHENQQSPPPLVRHVPPPPQPPPPAQSQNHPFQRSALHIPRYPDLPTIFFGGGDGASVGGHPQQHSVSNTGGEQRSHNGRPPSPPKNLQLPAVQRPSQPTAPSQQFPAPMLQRDFFANGSSHNCDPLEMQHENGLVDRIAQDSAREVAPWTSQSMQEASAMANILAAKANTHNVSVAHHLTLLSAEDAASAAAVAGASDAALLNPFLAAAGSLGDDPFAMASGDETPCGNDGHFEMEVEGAMERATAHEPAGERCLARSAPPQPHTAAVQCESVGNTCQASPRGVLETEPPEATNASSTPTTAYNPFADLNASGDDADDGFCDLR
ncbi:hypothetical protein, conserved [Leishmania tarentolae]|uniref:Vesicle tethering protein Uso1/P115-like head domain-containing protein n=1 Tax=Leishmania tarentolae TaxID=5689 RepID=A0A640KT28_LEITA|nr:hypothetical protein, conserved [Leishmania tarentolae]